MRLAILQVFCYGGAGMSLARLKETFLRLPKHMKLIGVGSFVLGISTFLPWYEDLDAYKIGDQFLGVTGPTSFVGIVILLLSVFSLWLFSYHLIERRTPKLPVREPIVHMFTAIESLFLLLLVISIFFHPKFGVNIIDKTPRFGMPFAFAGAFVLLFGAYFHNKAALEKERGEGRLEPLIKLESEKSTAPSALHERPAGGLYSRPLEEQKKKLFPHARSSVKGFVFGEKETVAKPEEKVQKKDEKENGGSYMIRMDL